MVALPALKRLALLESGGIDVTLQMVPRRDCRREPCGCFSRHRPHPAADVPLWLLEHVRMFRMASGYYLIDERL